MGVPVDQSQNRLPGLLGKLGKMTSIRDTDVLEQSLLRTLGPLLGVLDTSLYRTDESLALARVIRYHRSKAVESDGMARVVETVEEVAPLIEVSDDVQRLTENVRLLNKPCTRRLADEYLIAYPLLVGTMFAGILFFSVTAKCRRLKMQ